MNHALIIDARQQLRWHQRLFSDTSTAMMWGIWLLLWRPVLIFTWVMSVKHPAALLHFLNMASFEDYMTALFSAVAALLLWSTLPSHKVKNPVARTLDDYASHFGIQPEQIEAGRAQTICVVHHDDEGRIIRIEST